MEKVTKQVIATKMIEVYAKDHALLKKQANKMKMSLRKYMEYLAELNR